MATPSRATHTSDTEFRFLRRSIVRHLAADRRSAATGAAYGQPAVLSTGQIEALLAAYAGPASGTFAMRP